MAVAGVARFDVWDGEHVAACVRRAAGASCCPGGGKVDAVRHVGQRACCLMRVASILCFFSASSWRGWCGLSFRAACMFQLA